MPASVVFCDICGVGINIVAGEHPYECHYCEAIVCNKCIRKSAVAEGPICTKCYKSDWHTEKRDALIQAFQDIIWQWEDMWGRISKYAYKYNSKWNVELEGMLPDCNICNKSIVRPQRIIVNNETKWCPNFCEDCFSKRICKWPTLTNKCKVQGSLRLKCQSYKKKG